MSDVQYQGKQPPYEIGRITGSRNENGEVTWTRQFMVNEDQVETYKAGEWFKGYPETTRSWSESEACMGYELTINYAGTNEKDDDDYSLDVSFSEEPIQAHPHWEKIKKKYKGRVVDDEVEFDEFLEQQVGGALRKDTERIKNPLFGTKTYLALKAVVRHTYTSSRRPSLSIIGRITKRVPGGFSTPEDHDWLIMPPKSQRKGKESYKNTIEYLLSPKGGWPEEVYELMEGKDLPDTDSDSQSPDPSPSNSPPPGYDPNFVGPPKPPHL